MEPEDKDAPTLLTCQECLKTDDTVRVRACGYNADVYDDPHSWETVCDDCEYEHCMDI